MKKITSCCLLLFAVSISLSAQYFGGFSSLLEWRVIESEHVRVIFFHAEHESRINDKL